MAYTLDPEIAAALAANGGGHMPPRGDWKTLRKAAADISAKVMGLVQPAPDVAITTSSVKSLDGADIGLRWYQRKDSVGGPAVVYAHGGGMIIGSAEMYDPIVAAYVSLTGVPFLSVDYRLAPEVQGTTLVEDTFAGLAWLCATAPQLGVDRNRIAVMGDSAGGGVAAGVAIAARDRQIKLARQILIYPMLDDRNTKPDPALEPVATWTYDNNLTGWSALLGSSVGGTSVSPLAAPARLTTFSGLAPAYIEVGELDIFRDESMRYAMQIAAAGISVELHVHPGATHGYDRLAPSAQLTVRAMADRLRIIKGL
jgi:acetyl esterase/lipase